MDISRIFGRPRNANGFIVVILLPSNDNFFKLRNPANASLLIIGKLFLVNDKFSTLGGSRLVGISLNPPVLHRTCKIFERKSLFCGFIFFVLFEILNFVQRNPVCWCRGSFFFAVVIRLAVKDAGMR